MQTKAAILALFIFSHLAFSHLAPEGAQGSGTQPLQQVGEPFSIYAFPEAAAVSRSSEFTIMPSSSNFSTLSARFDIRLIQTEEEHEVFSTSIYGENPSFTYAFNDGAEHRMEVTMEPLDGSAPTTYKYLIKVQPQNPTPELQARVLLALAGIFFAGALIGRFAGNNLLLGKARA